MDESVIKRPELLAPLVLAYIGDSVYEVYVRTRIVSEHSDMPAGKLHKESIKHVSAKAQANSILSIESILDEDELAIYKRGRNAKSSTVPKNADITQYRQATGFEALVGYLYLSGRKERLSVIMKAAYENGLNK